MPNQNSKFTYKIKKTYSSVLGKYVFRGYERKYFIYFYIPGSLSLTEDECWETIIKYDTLRRMRKPNNTFIRRIVYNSGNSIEWYGD